MENNNQQSWTIRTMSADIEKAKKSPEPSSVPAGHLPKGDNLSDVSSFQSPPAPVAKPLLFPPPPKNYLKLFSIIFAVILIGGGAMTGIIYWLKYQPVPGQEVGSEQTLAQLAPFEKKEIIVLKENDSLLNGLLEIKEKEFAASTLIRILIKRQKEQKNSERSPERREEISLKEFIAQLDLNIPSQITSLFTQDYNLFLYSQKPRNSLSALNKLGIVFSLKEPSQAPSLMRQWEKTIINDLKPLFLGEETVSSLEFKESERKDVLPHQYVNLPNSERSLDYIIYKSLLIIATSKESMDKVLDLVLGQKTE